MTDIFVSYASGDRERVRTLVQALEADGYSVWWDRAINAGTAYDREIERAIEHASCMVVVWTQDSIESEYVRSEIEEGARRNMLVPLLFEDVLPPLAHRRTQAANLIDWAGEHNAQYEMLLAGVEAALARSRTEADQDAGSVVTPARAVRPRRFSLSRSTVRAKNAAIGAALIAVVVFLGTWLALRPAPAEPRLSTRFHLQLPDGMALRGSRPAKITRDGRQIFLRTTGTYPVHVRSLEALDVVPLDNVDANMMTSGSLNLSPNGEWLVFRDGNGYKKVSTIGGLPVQLTRKNAHAFDWGPGDVIVVGQGRGLGRIPPSGGEPEPLTQPEDGDWHRQPYVLPDGNAVLYGVGQHIFNMAHIAVVSLDTGRIEMLIDGESPQYVLSGHLLFVREESVWAVPFDTRSLKITGDPVPVLAAEAYSVSDDGTLVYVHEENTETTELVWVDREGREEPIEGPPARYWYPRIAPDGNRYAVVVAFGDETDLWVFDQERSLNTRVTFDEFRKIFPAWHPDGDRLAYSASEQSSDQPFNISTVDADGTGQALPLASGRSQSQLAWSPDGKALFYKESNNLSIYSFEGERGQSVLRETRHTEGNPVLSPDGRWLAYESNESGVAQIFVRPYPNLDDGRWQLSSYGSNPRWGPGGRELYYEGAEHMMSVAIRTEPDFEVGDSRPLFELATFLRSHYDVSPDGQRFLMVRPTSESRTEVIVVMNWLEELERLVPVDGT